MGQPRKGAVKELDQRKELAGGWAENKEQVGPRDYYLKGARQELMAGLGFEIKQLVERQ
jgi:hypothetical protein